MTGVSADWTALNLHPDSLYIVAVDAAAETATDPSYIINQSSGTTIRKYSQNSVPTRRISSDSASVCTANSTINITAPYFNVELEWINATATEDPGRISDARYSDTNPDSFSIRNDGAVASLHDGLADYTTNIPEAPQVFTGSRLLWIRVYSMPRGTRMQDGSLAGPDTPCPTNSAFFGDLPSVPQYKAT